MKWFNRKLNTKKVLEKLDTLSQIELDLFISDIVTEYRNSPDPNKIMNIWEKDDILATADKLKFKLSNDQVRDVLSMLERKHDANIGINWNVIEFWVEEIVDQENNEIWGQSQISDPNMVEEGFGWKDK